MGFAKYMEDNMEIWVENNRYKRKQVVKKILPLQERAICGRTNDVNNSIQNSNKVNNVTYNRH